MYFSSLTIKKINEGLKNKEFSAAELIKSYLNKIKKYDKEISSFLTLTPDLALSQAQEIDEKILKNDDLQDLAGIPFAVKDNILTEGIKCTAGSKILENYIAPYNATVIKKLRAEGAIILGKTNLDEFAMGSSTENSAFGSTKNPRDLSRVPGGSSGGSAAAVAADFSCCALGSDTGGSIRQPSSFCGVAGFKPSYGAVSRYGLMAMASSLDQIGPIAKTAEDCRIVFEAIRGKDSFDSTSIEYNKLHATHYMLKDLKIGLPKEYFIGGIDSEVEKIIKEAVKKFENRGAKIIEISLPHTEYALAVYYIIMASEVSANLARYDGVKYGLSKREGKNLLDVYLDSREQGFGSEVKRRIMLGTFALSSGYYEAYYLRAQKVRTKILEDFKKAFEKVDVILTPVSPFPAFKFGEKVANPLSMYLSDIFTVSVNLAGLPAISVPAGETDSLAVGLQIIGPAFGDKRVLSVAEAFEKF